MTVPERAWNMPIRSAIFLAISVRGLHGKEGKASSSFLKKRTKKLLLIASSVQSKRANMLPPAIDKSFLVLSFKKELLGFLLFNVLTLMRNHFHSVTYMSV
jgi:hypothetical protein